MTNHSEILKAAHRQAKRMQYVGGPSYAGRLSVAMREMYVAAKCPGVASVGRGYGAHCCGTLSVSQRMQLEG